MIINFEGLARHASRRSDYDRSRPEAGTKSYARPAAHLEIGSLFVRIAVELVKKLDALEAYLRFYNTALKNQPFTRIYIDAFAGSPVSKVRGSGVPPEPSPFFDEAEDIEAQEQFILGSPVRALNIENGFHRHYFFDLDERRAAILRELCGANEGVTVRVGDCNPLILELAATLHVRNLRGRRVPRSLWRAP